MCARSRSKGHTESLAGAVCLCMLYVSVWSMSMYAALFVILGSCTCSRSHSVRLVFFVVTGTSLGHVLMSV